MCQNFAKTEDQCSQAMEEATKEALENNMHHHDTMKIIARAYLSNRECSVQKTVYHILPELKLSRIFPAAYFVNTSLSEEIIQALLPAKNLSKLPDDSPNIFKRSNIDRYMVKTKGIILQWKIQCFKSFLLRKIFSILHP